MTTVWGDHVTKARRKFLRLALVASAEFGVLTYGGAYAVYAEPNWLSIERVTLPFKNLPDALNGFTLAQISDLHVGPQVSPETIARAVDTINSLQPSLIAVTGDLALYATYTRRRVSNDARLCAAELARLRAPLGVFAALGNHDHWDDTTVVTRILRDAGVTALVNQGRLVERNDQALWLAGFDKMWQYPARLKAALAGAPRDVPTILLAHEPDVADQVAADGRVWLQLSGHSHGGQVRLPIVGAPVLPNRGRKYPMGLRRVGGMWLYTNRGIGVVPPPIRINCRPEVTLFTLIQDQPSHSA
jgi:predicted MPP superfamily phosphohydrolase